MSSTSQILRGLTSPNETRMSTQQFLAIQQQRNSPNVVDFGKLSAQTINGLNANLSADALNIRSSSRNMICMTPELTSGLVSQGILHQEVPVNQNQNQLQPRTVRDQAVQVDLINCETFSDARTVRMGSGLPKSSEYQTDRNNNMVARAGIQSPMNQLIFRIPESDQQSSRTGVSATRRTELERRSKEAQVESSGKNAAASSLVKGVESFSSDSGYNMEEIVSSNKKTPIPGFLNSQFVMATNLDDRNKASHARQLSKSDTSIKKMKEEIKIDGERNNITPNNRHIENALKRQDTAWSSGMREVKAQSFDDLARAAEQM